MLYTTLNDILKYCPCGQDPNERPQKGWCKLLNHLGKTEADDEPLSILTILESNGLEDALWALRAVDGHDREIRLLACDFAEHVLPIYEREYPNDRRVRTCIAVARRYATGDATHEAWAARDAAWAAAWAATGTAGTAEFPWQEAKLREMLAAVEE
jgi:hypothetical protein